jgi:SpoVK/Ycf46/Vps4 family AAA+-type ATPase
MIKKSVPIPILLFNEADAVLGKRQELGDQRRGPAQTENAIQNIILQELENLQGGILIATTNMTVNLDKAFERRFLYKVEFEKPGITAKTAIWKIHLPELSQVDAETLSRRYDFSGGQIENITRKHTISVLLSGRPLTLADIETLCEEELLEKGAPRIGFGA